jgi:ribosome-binding factor A
MANGAQGKVFGMTTRRMAKASEAIRETVSTTILFELKDPRVKNVTVLRAEAAGDLKTAKVYISVMGDAKKQSLCMHGLESARGFIQAKLADRLQTKYTPVLKFVLDPGVKLSAMTAQLLKENQPPAADATEADDDEHDDADNDEAMTAAEEEAGAQDGP